MKTLGRFVRHIDRRYGIRSRLKGEPPPPVGGFDLDGEKILDWGWICVQLPDGPKKGLEIGCGQSPVLAAMLANRYDVIGIDLNPAVSRQIGGFTFISGDFNQIDLQPGFDVIVSCSSIEHFGISGRYGSLEDPDADLKAIRKIRVLLARNGLVLLTIPVGIDAIHRPWHRVYGAKRLPLLLGGFTVEKSRYLIKQPSGPWFESSREAAINFPVDPRRYALGEFALRLN